MIGDKSLFGALIAVVALSAGAEGKAVALGETLPGQTQATVTDTVVLADRKTHASLRHPFVMLSNLAYLIVTHLFRLALLDTPGDILACVLRHKHTLVSFR